MEIEAVFKSVASIVSSPSFSKIVQNISLVNQYLQQSPTPAQNPSSVIRQQLTPIRQQQKQRAETALREILDLHDLLSLELTAENKEALVAFGVSDFLSETFKNIISAAIPNIDAEPSKTKPVLTGYHQALSRIQAIYNALRPFESHFPLKEPLKEPLDIVKLFFQGKAEINNLDELTSVSGKLNQVFIAFAVLTRENDRTIRIEKVERGSIILTLAAAPAIIYGFAKATDKILDTVKKCYEIKKLAAEVRKLNHESLSNVTIDLDTAAKLHLKNEAEKISALLAAEYDWSKQDNRGDVNAGIIQAIRYMLKFINNGGRIEVKLVEKSEESKALEASISNKHTEIRRLVNQLLIEVGHTPLLDCITDDEDPSGEAQQAA